MDFSVPIFLKALFHAAQTAGLLDLVQKTGEALYGQLIQDKLGPLFKTKLGRWIENALQAVAAHHAVPQSHFILCLLTDPTVADAMAKLGSGELPTRSLLVPVFQRLLPGADAALATDRFVEKLYDGLSRDQELVNHALLLLSEKEAERHQTLLRMLQTISQQLQQPQTAPAPPLPAIPTTRLALVFSRAADGQFSVALQRGEEMLVPPQSATLPAGFEFTHEDYLKALAAGVTRGWTMPMASREQLLDRLGRQLAEFLLPGEIGKKVHDTIDEAQRRNERVEITFRASDPKVLSLPIEATHDPVINLPLVLYPHVAVSRSLIDTAAKPATSIPGPLRLLVLIASPDEEKTQEPLLDLEAELRTILDAVDHASHGGNCIVEILEEGSLENLSAKLEAEPSHVLHISCHGRPGILIFEDRDGNPVAVTPQKLADTIAATGHPHVPLIVLASCLTGVAAKDGEADLGSFAAQLLQRGFPAVVAMQHPVSDAYATALAGYLYQHLADDEVPSPLWALSKARRQVELERQQGASGKGQGTNGKEQGANGKGQEPEYATPALYLGGEDMPLFDRRQPFDRIRPQPQLFAVPGLCLRRVGDFIGRRRQQRQLRRALADNKKIGALITGMGGVGKSALAAHLVENLVKEGWLAVTVVGRTNETEICHEVGNQLWSFAEQRQLPHDHELRRRATPLRAVYEITDEQRRSALWLALQHWPVLLLLDNFEDNLEKDCQTLRDPELEGFLQKLAELPLRARLLLTCRYPVPALKYALTEIPLGPLSVQEMRKLLLRLPHLNALAGEERLAVYRKVGGHPRLLEFLDALLGGGVARFPDVSRKLAAKLAELNIAAEALPETLDEALQAAVAAGCRDILLNELIALAQQQSADWDLLLGTTVYEQPVDLTGLAFQRFGRPARTNEHRPLAASASRLANLSLLSVVDHELYFVHRWTAGPLLQHATPAQQRHLHQRAADYWQWRVQNQTHNIHEAILGVRHLLQAENVDAAFGEGSDILVKLMKWGHYSEAASLNREMLACFPATHSAYPRLSSNLGDLMMGLGETEAARQYYEKALEIRAKLAAQEPNRADYARDLSVSYERMGDLLRSLGEGSAARQYYEKALEIAAKLAAQEPNRADYARDLSVSYERMGDLLRSLGEGSAARQYYEKALDIRLKLAAQEPNLLERQLDLVVSFYKLGLISPPPVKRDYLNRGLQILRALQKNGKLPPANAGWLAIMEQELAQTK
ncbi:MAG: CHAT domain-containing protein [candidate division KSB1 bacterium]|nr:CHAT domain-containing protein [candidate division KSB1 bacterium]MDZ7394349.1 CHAT domain-containing protein [candidate division KSB1 bacterium]MDZ7414655.1 CHAT domain-containing protein [candidate division KSB1 bacterium]